MIRFAFLLLHDYFLVLLVHNLGICVQFYEEFFVIKVFFLLLLLVKRRWTEMEMWAI